MKIQRAYKTKIIVNNVERSYLAGCAGFARWVYNWAIDDVGAMYAAQLFTGDREFRYNRNEQKKAFNAIKDSLIPWNREYSYKIMESVLYEDFPSAMNRFFTEPNAGFPKRKKRGARKSFRLRGVGEVESSRINVKNKIGWLRLKEHGYIPAEAKINSVTILEDAGHWYISVQCEIEIDDPIPPTGPPIGVNFGVTELAVTSAGQRIGRKPLYQSNQERLARLQRELSRRKRFSQNWYKTQKKIAKLHRKIRNKRRHVQHNISSDIVYKSGASKIIVDDFDVASMMSPDVPFRESHQAQKNLNKSIADAGIYEMARQTEYKAGWNGTDFERAERFYPSSRKCNSCGWIKSDLTLTDRTWTCEQCGAEIEREENAALNLEQYTPSV